MLIINNSLQKARNKIFIRLFILCSFLLTFAVVQGQTTFLNRPSKTESATVLEKGVFQIESTFVTELTGDEDERERETLFPSISLKYGIGWGVELSFANQYETFDDQLMLLDGFTDIDIGAKIQLLKGTDKKTEVALLSHLFLPTGSKGISNARVGNETSVLVWHELTEKMGIEYSIGYSNIESDSEKGDFIYSFVTDYEIHDKSGIFIETYGEFLEFEALEASIDFGFAYQFTDNLELELAIGSGINHKMFLALIGLSWRIGEQAD